MPEIKSILYAIDFSDSQKKILPMVQEMLAKHGSALHLVYVVRDMDHYANFYVPHPDLQGMIDGVVAGAQRKMKEFVDHHFDGDPSIKTTVLDGDPALQVVKYAQDNGIDLIIMGTHGRKGLEHVIFGSVAEKVVKNSGVPVLTVNPHRS